MYELLNSAINDKRQIYVHLVEEGNQKWKETLNREQQLQFICELVMQQIENNFEWEE
ncbi:type II toxin-antitoxin system antitoxin, TscA family [Staphylococcus warneri]|uniref:TscA family type II toxin-antitoxin system antitoxin n=1 Tax=Staphylococcus warneri TaxID=1292 RepID=UPI003BF7E97D